MRKNDVAQGEETKTDVKHKEEWGCSYVIMESEKCCLTENQEEKGTLQSERMPDDHCTERASVISGNLQSLLRSSTAAGWEIPYAACGRELSCDT